MSSAMPSVKRQVNIKAGGLGRMYPSTPPSVPAGSCQLLNAEATTTSNLHRVFGPWAARLVFGGAQTSSLPSTPRPGLSLQPSLTPRTLNFWCPSILSPPLLVAARFLVFLPRRALSRNFPRASIPSFHQPYGKQTLVALTSSRLRRLDRLNATTLRCDTNAPAAVNFGV